jgi:hypothetical protein
LGLGLAVQGKVSGVQEIAGFGERQEAPRYVLYFFLTGVELESAAHQKDVEIQVLNQMITSANKMVQVKNIEVGRLQKKLAHSAKYLQTMNSADRMRMEQERLDMSYMVINS